MTGIMCNSLGRFHVNSMLFSTRPLVLRKVSRKLLSFVRHPFQFGPFRLREIWTAVPSVGHVSSRNEPGLLDDLTIAQNEHTVWRKIPPGASARKRMEPPHRCRRSRVTGSGGAFAAASCLAAQPASSREAGVAIFWVLLSGVAGVAGVGTGCV